MMQLRAISTEIQFLIYRYKQCCGFWCVGVRPLTTSDWINSFVVRFTAMGRVGVVVAHRSLAHF